MLRVQVIVREIRGKGTVARDWTIGRIFNLEYHSHRQAFVFTREYHVI